jgi:hypothetical protein
MRAIATMCLGGMLAACSMTAKDGTPIVREGPFPGDGSLIGTIKELSDPGSTYKQRTAAADTKCRELGFKAGTDAFANCRLQLETARVAERRAVQSRSAADDDGQGGTVYSAGECIGPVIMGRCQGSVIPNGAYHPTCHGELLNGQCTGPMF